MYPELLPWLGNQRRDARAFQNIEEESFTHREHRPQHSDGPKAGSQNRLHRGVHDAQQRHVHGLLHFVEDKVHRVRCDEPKIGTGKTQPL